MAHATEILSKVTGVYVCDKTRWGEKPKNLRAVYSGSKSGKFIMRNGKKVDVKKLSSKKYQLCFSNVEMDRETRRWSVSRGKKWAKGQRSG